MNLPAPYTLLVNEAEIGFAATPVDAVLLAYNEAQARKAPVTITHPGGEWVEFYPAFPRQAAAFKVRCATAPGLYLPLDEIERDGDLRRVQPGCVWQSPDERMDSELQAARARSRFRRKVARQHVAQAGRAA